MALPQKELSTGQANPLRQSDEFAPVGRFLWDVGAYRVEKGFALTLGGSILKRSEPFLAEADQPAKHNLYTPLEDHRELFTTFAAIKNARDPSPADAGVMSVLNFANVFGRLGIPRASFVAHAPLKPKESVPVKSGESIADWLRQARAMKSALALLEGIQKNDFGDMIQWKEDWVYYRAPDGNSGALIANATNHYASFYHRWKRGDLEGPARLHLAVEINSRLRNNVAPQLAFDDSHQFNEYTRPLDLLGAMWYQMCRAFTGEQPIGRCAECHKWMICDRSTKTMHERCAVKVRQRRYREAQNGKTKTR